MTKDSQKGNYVVIAVAVIGVVGTIIAATINVIGNYNIEKLRQDTELTRIAVQSTVNAPATAKPPSYQEKNIDVNAKADWQNTNLWVDAGDTIAITYISGSWSACALNGCPYIEPDGILVDGSINHPNNVMSGCLHAALIARIANTSICIGNNKTMQASETGVLELRINDIIIEDDDGIVTVRVQIQK